MGHDFAFRRRIPVLSETISIIVTRAGASLRYKTGEFTLESRRAICDPEDSNFRCPRTSPEVSSRRGKAVEQRRQGIASFGGPTLKTRP